VRKSWEEKFHPDPAFPPFKSSLLRGIMLYAETCRDATAVVAAVTGCFLRAGEEVLVTAERGQVADPLEKGDTPGCCRLLLAKHARACS
jgi:hypothetical protein